ncbi:MAG TPA: HAD family hydrolase, partial [Wenzhouxiangellaceae bacterium]|nr:HAD family hydrolase [Wenzhouxiangellaceae bacterium]
MKTVRCLVLLAAVGLGATAQADPLPSWADTEARTRIIDFVTRVTDPGSPDYVTPSARVAVFDNDGTLWSERPVYFQFLFAVDRLQEMAADDPTILDSDVLRAAARGDMKAVVAAGEQGLLEILKVTHAGMTVAAFQQEVSDWIAGATHPETGLAYSAMVFQPMLELLRYLRDEDFSTYIVSGGGLHFMRAVTETLYDIPPENVIGSAGETRYVVVDGVPQLMKDPAIAFIDDKEGKPVGIDAKIGRRPIFAAGNSDGDFAMLEYTMAGDGLRLALLVH